MGSDLFHYDEVRGVVRFRAFLLKA